MFLDKITNNVTLCVNVITLEKYFFIMALFLVNKKSHNLNYLCEHPNSKVFINLRSRY